MMQKPGKHALNFSGAWKQIRFLLGILLLAYSRVVPAQILASQDLRGLDTVLIRPIGTDSKIIRQRIVEFEKAEWASTEKEYSRVSKLFNKRLGSFANMKGAKDPIDQLGNSQFRLVMADFDELVRHVNKRQTAPSPVPGPYPVTASEVRSEIQNANYYWRVARGAAAIAAARAADLRAAQAISSTSKTELEFRRLRAEITMEAFSATQELQRHNDALLAIFEQGTREEILARHEKWLQVAAVDQARRRAEIADQQDKFAARIADNITGAVGAVIAAQAVNDAMAEAEKIRDPNYPKIMAQAREAYRLACTAQGGRFTVGTGDNVGVCRY